MSVRRWGSRDSFGQPLLAATNDIETIDDRQFRIRLKRPFSQMRKRRSSMVSISFVAASNGCPNESREPQRRTDIAQSFAWTGSPSWNVKPSRKVNVQVSPSADTSCPAHICGRDWAALDGTAPKPHAGLIDAKGWAAWLSGV